MTLPRYYRRSGDSSSFSHIFLLQPRERWPKRLQSPRKLFLDSMDQVLDVKNDQKLLFFENSKKHFLGNLKFFEIQIFQIYEIQKISDFRKS